MFLNTDRKFGGFQVHGNQMKLQRERRGRGKTCGRGRDCEKWASEEGGMDKTKMNKLAS